MRPQARRDDTSKTLAREGERLVLERGVGGHGCGEKGAGRWSKGALPTVGPVHSRLWVRALPMHSAPPVLKNHRFDHRAQPSNRESSSLNLRCQNGQKG